MSMSGIQVGAWGGDRARKQASIGAARAALAAGPVVMCFPALRLAAAERAGDPSNVYCAAYGTADPAELEARAGLPVSTLMLASAALIGCEHWGQAGEGGSPACRLVVGSGEAPLLALEAIPVGADPVGLARSYVVDLLGKLVVLRDRAGQGLGPESLALVSQLKKLHAEGCADPATLRTLRHTATAATDAASGDLEATVLRFVESAAWPLVGLTAELPELTMDLHLRLRLHLAPEGTSAAERATLDALSAVYEALDRRLKADPTLDFQTEMKKIEALPESVAANEPALVVRMQYYDRVAAEAHVPFAVDLLIGAFRKA